MNKIKLILLIFLVGSVGLWGEFLAYFMLDRVGVLPGQVWLLLISIVNIVLFIFPYRWVPSIGNGDGEDGIYMVLAIHTCICGPLILRSLYVLAFWFA